MPSFSPPSQSSDEEQQPPSPPPHEQPAPLSPGLQARSQNQSRSHHGHSSSQSRSQSHYSPFAKSAIMSAADNLAPGHSRPLPVRARSSADSLDSHQPSTPHSYRAYNDTPSTSANTSPRINPMTLSQDPTERIRRQRPTTLDIPGLTRSSVSPDGRIAQRDIGSKLVIVMVGLPARGKSYITKKLTRYLNWLQHDTHLFNVGERRRVVAGGQTLSSPNSPIKQSSVPLPMNGILNQTFDPAALAEQILNSGGVAVEGRPEQTQQAQGDHDNMPSIIPELILPEAAGDEEPEQFPQPVRLPEPEQMDQSAAFFDPNNEKAAKIREKCALDTLDELLDYILNQGGAVGILDATNNTVQRRRVIMNHIREIAGPELNVLFVESVCIDENLLERNMRLKLNGPDYKDKDPEASLADFKKRVLMYEQSYVPLGEYEEKHSMPYVQMIDVGRKVICHQIKGFLSTQAVNYLMNFNLAPRQIWITRHGQSQDNEAGKIGGDSSLTGRGRQYAKTLAEFMGHERKAWEVHELDKRQQANLSPLPGDTTPPNPHYTPDGDEDHILGKNFCVWTSMLQRSIQTAQFFDEDEFDVKQMKMLDEINAGWCEGMTYEHIKENLPDEFEERRFNKLQYRYPGPGGESYLDVINRLRPVIVELERMTDHVLLIGHRSIARILLAYFMGLARYEVADLDVPIGMLFCLEPKPYGVDFKAYRYDSNEHKFELQPNYKLRQTQSYLD